MGTGIGFRRPPQRQNLGFIVLTPPYFSESPQNRTATVGVEFTYEVDEASDDGGDAITYAASQADGSALPTWLAFDPDTRTFSGTPGVCDAPATLDIMVTATDDGEIPQSDAVTFTLTVQPAAGVTQDGSESCEFGPLIGPEDQKATVGVEFSYKIEPATDDGGDAITYAASQADGSALPTWLAFDPDTVTFSGVPGPCDVAVLKLMVTATDDSEVPQSATVAFTLTVAPDQNLPPEFCGVYVLTVPENSPEGVNVGAPVTAIDPNGDPLRYIGLDGTDGKSFNLDPQTGQITTKAGVDYDYETKPSYTFMVVVEEQGTNDSYLSGVVVTVNLTDVEEAADQTKEEPPEDETEDETADQATEDPPEDGTEGEEEEEETATAVTACFTDLGALDQAAEYAGAWDAADCAAHHQSGRGRYFQFTPTTETTVTITLTSESDAALYVSKGEPANGWATSPKGTYDRRCEVRRNNGSLVHHGPHVATAENDGNTVTLTLAASSTYTVEVAGDTDGTFTVSIEP